MLKDECMKIRRETQNKRKKNVEKYKFLYFITVISEDVAMQNNLQ